MIKIGSKEVPNEITELTVEQFEKISNLTNNQELEPFEKWSQIFVSLGADIDELEDTEFNKFKEYIAEFVSVSIEPNKEFVKSIEVDGYTYQSFDEEFKLNVKDLKLIEKCISHSPDNYISKVLAILFKRTDLTKAEHYDESHITFKSKLFKTQPAEMAIPFIVYIGDKLSATAKQVIDEPTEVVE